MCKNSIAKQYNKSSKKPMPKIKKNKTNNKKFMNKNKLRIYLEESACLSTSFFFATAAEFMLP